MITTSRLQLQVPQSTDDQSNYPANAQQAFGVLDDAVLVTEGALTSRPPASGVQAGNEYIATDAGQRAVSDGVAWNTTGFSGEMRMSAAATTPSGWLLCDGSAYSRTTYVALFDAIGTAYGPGDGSTTFNVPDCRGRTIVGAGQGAGLTLRSLGNTGGEETHVLTLGETASHSHGVTDPGHEHRWGQTASPEEIYTLIGIEIADYLFGATRFYLGPPGEEIPETSAQISTTGITINNAGGGSAHNNLQPFVVASMIIKT